MKKALYILFIMLLGSLTIQAQQISYQWSTGDTTATFDATPLTTTTYYVTVTQYGESYVDSVTVYVNLTDSLMLTQTACESYTWPQTGLSYTTSGIYTDTLTNAAGCDSVLYLALTIYQSASSTESISACDNYTWAANGQTYDSSGVYVDTLSTIHGCDSVVALNLTILPSVTVSTSDSAVATYTWPQNGETYTVSGTYYDTLQTTTGCDSIIALALTILPPLEIEANASDTVICEGGTVLISVNTQTDSASTAFIMKVRTTNPGTTNNNQFQLTGALGEYNIVAEHIASGVTETFNNLQGQQTLTFSNGPGDYLVKVFPTGSTPFHRIQFNNTGDRSKLLEIQQWGTVEWSSLEKAFYGCDSMNIVSVDLPDFTGVQNASRAFQSCETLDGPSNINNWNVSAVLDMSMMFDSALVFNQNVEAWNVENVTDMRSMFAWAKLFNQDIGNWDVGNVTNMRTLFFHAEDFNQDIGGWDVSAVTTMQGTFHWATDFNQDIGNWNVSNVTSMRGMFHVAGSFNQDLNGWDVSNVTTMYHMFGNAGSFNGAIGNWDVSSVQNMTFTFRSASNFNQDIGNWDVSSATQMNYMFYEAISFNQDIGDWDVSTVGYMNQMFYNAQSFNQDLSSWCVANIDSLPVNFSINSALDSANHPVWGTCADLYPSGTVFCNGVPTAVVEVTNPITGKTWMDRNLGASQAATNSLDALSYGDLYQWGRPSDGHQCRNSDTTHSSSSLIIPGHDEFIIVTPYVTPYDWLSPQNVSLWQGVNGLNNPCPLGFRIPTESELSNEQVSWTSYTKLGAINSVLKLPITGNRSGSLGTVYSSSGHYWSSTTSGTFSKILYFNNTVAYTGNGSRSGGLAVRCIKD